MDRGRPAGLCAALSFNALKRKTLLGFHEAQRRVQFTSTRPKGVFFGKRFHQGRPHQRVTVALPWPKARSSIVASHLLMPQQQETASERPRRPALTRQPPQHRPAFPATNNLLQIKILRLGQGGLEWAFDVW